MHKSATQDNLSLDDQTGSDKNLGAAENLLSLGKYRLAQDQLNLAQIGLGENQLTLTLAIFHKNEQAKQEAVAAVATPAQPSNARLLPILFYHKPPGDFDAQLTQLAAKGYTTVTMADVASYLSGRATPPAKPAVITFDDGFADQLGALPILQRHHMKATLYLITAGERSQWCIGIERRPGNCGDAYLGWDEVRQMMNSGLIEIGDHTVDHSNLPTLSAADQTFEIVSAKQRLESMLGITITTFAYPYGSFNSTTINIVRQAGFSTAVSTISGLYQSPDTIYALRRMRNVSQLP